MNLFKKINLFVFIVFYLAAGVNHFRSPEVYEALIPPYLPYHSFLNCLSGVLEMVAGILMIIPSTRKISAVLIIGLLIAFIPAHIYHIQMKGCVHEKLCVQYWVAILRLPFQFILIWWAYKTAQWSTVNKNVT